MKLAKVVGNVVSTVKTESHHRCKLMVVLPVDTEGNPVGDSVIAVDGVNAGIGETVLIVEEGGSAREVMHNPQGAYDTVIVGIVDEEIN
jgi:microcompartment protein CcmK/EutM